MRSTAAVVEDASDTSQHPFRHAGHWLMPLNMPLVPYNMSKTGLVQLTNFLVSNWSLDQHKTFELVGKFGLFL